MAEQSNSIGETPPVGTPLTVQRKLPVRRFMMAGHDEDILVVWDRSTQRAYVVRYWG
jgi:hypothetical protein